MVKVQLYERWERLSIKKGYNLMRTHKVSKPRSVFEAVKGVKIYTVGGFRK